ncbi:hypothetical protein K488DRAFT_67325 [Vararia minispora EC-137]|uniref:Uncharacterized protein n=1 Tax=Vararia minispora EC-137 TaxID=1314806 RepID=A0ACB8QYQ2_9AGAM|nr:hypothetical protein K488DRAFT_67325 [Vararia minispora EC-137]
MSSTKSTFLDHRRLPPELWIRILDLTAVLPGQLDTDAQDPFDDPCVLPLPYIISPKNACAAFAAVQEDRASLALVSRLWNAVVTPLLYKTAYIGTNRSLISLASTLAHSDRNAISRGHNIRRLDLMMTNADGLSVEAMEALKAVFERVPNLQILNVCTSAQTPSYAPRPILCALRDTCAASLKTFAWDPASSLRPTMTDMQALLCSFRHLRTLGQLWWPECDGYFLAGCPYALPHFLMLKSIALPYGHDDHGCPPPHFGALQQVVLGSITPDGCIDAFVAAHAETLRIAYVEVVAEEQSLGALTGCPALRHLVLYMTRDMVRALSCWALPDAVTHLGVHVDAAPREAMRELVLLLGHLSSMDARGLCVVRLLHLSNEDLAEFVRTDGFALAYDTFSRKGWELEDRAGRRMSPPRIGVAIF